jgi:hypothetical protein
MHKKWNAYGYLKSDTTIGNFEARITKFIVTRRPLQFTHCTEWCFYGTASENQFILLLHVTQFCVIHFKTLPYAKSYITFTAVYCSSFLHSFPGLALTSLCIHATWALRFSLQLSICHWNPIYGMVSFQKVSQLDC